MRVWMVMNGYNECMAHSVFTTQRAAQHFITVMERDDEWIAQEVPLFSLQEIVDHMHTTGEKTDA